MSTANAAWLYNRPRSATSSSTPAPTSGMDLTNGFGDWNASFAQYRTGSALS